MKQKQSDDFDNFDKVMDSLLAVPYSELQRKIEEEKQEKARKKRPTLTASSARASSSRKKKVV